MGDLHTAYHKVDEDSRMAVLQWENSGVVVVASCVAVAVHMDRDSQVRHAAEGHKDRLLQLLLLVVDMHVEQRAPDSRLLVLPPVLQVERCPEHSEAHTTHAIA